MHKIFIFWIVFIVILITGIILAISSKSVLKREERRAEELRRAVISRRSSLIPMMPTVGEAVPEKPRPAVKAVPEKLEPVVKVTPENPRPAADAVPEKPKELSTSGEIQPLKDIPVQINTNSLEVVMPASSSSSNASATPLNPSEQVAVSPSTLLETSEVEPIRDGESLNPPQNEESSQIPSAAE